MRFKNLLRQAAEKVAHMACSEEAAEILRPLSDVLSPATDAGANTRAIAAFANRSFHRVFQLPLDVPEWTTVARGFHIRPLLPFFSGRDMFYILALSQKQVRLFEADRFEAREIHFEVLPSDLREMLRSQSFENELQFHAVAEGSGKRGIVYHGGRNEPKDRLKEYLREVASALFQGNSGEAPLVIASVQYVASIYRSVNRYPNLSPDVVAGNPDLLSIQELHDRALAIAGPCFNGRIVRALERWQELKHTRLVSRDLWEIAAAARGGQVRTLFLASCVHHPDASGEDMLNSAASDALLHAADVHEIPRSEMPEQAEIAAIFRY